MMLSHSVDRTLLGLQPRDRRVADVVGARDLGQRLTSPTPGEGLLLLVRCQLRLPPEPNPFSLRPLAPLTRPSTDELTLELSKPPEHRQHQPPMWGRRI